MIKDESLKLKEIMSQAQVFASAWSIVGGRFDGGNGMEEAEIAKNELHQMIAKALAQPEPWEKFCDSNCVWTDHHPDCKLAQQESVTWRNAAIRVGEDLCSVGPFGYYDMTAEQWLDWALSVVTVHAPPPQRNKD